MLTFAEMVHMGDTLVRTGFLPSHIKTGAQAAAIILTGQELGMTPMRALRSLNMVKGKVTENADSQLARFKTDGGRAVFKELTESVAVLWLRHPNGDEHLERFTMEDAKAAGLTNPVPRRDGNGTEPSMFTKFPKAMLRSRVITAGLKSIGWEGGAGAYDPSELPAPIVTATIDESAEQNAGTQATQPKALTLGEARALVIPGEPGKGWKGHAGKKLDECSNNLLNAVGGWTVKQLQVEGAHDPANDAMLERLMRGCKLVLTARANGELKEPPKPEKVEKPAAEPAAPAAETTPAGTPIVSGGLPGSDEELPF